MSENIRSELKALQLGDRRLDQRAGKILEALAADPAASINAASGGWSETLGAYRFLDNLRVTPEKLLQPHRQATEARIDEQPVALVVQDTTELDFTAHAPQDAGVLNTENRYGLYDHSHLAFTPQGLCLGVLDVEFFDRSAQTLGEGEERKTDPAETKESYRWLEGYRLACEVAARHPQTQVISVADSESDLYDIFLEAARHPTPADFVIRASQNRCTPQRDPEAGPQVFKKVRDEVAQADVAVVRELELPQTPKREARTARLEIRAKRLTLKPPHARSSLGPVEMNLVLVEETGRPADDPTTVRWLLLTSLPIDTPTEVLRVADTYTARWPIEPFFRVYKTGCRVEEIQLETTARLKRCLIFYKIIAWRIMHVTFLGRDCPELPCDEVFAEQEWKSVWRVTNEEPLPDTPPSLSEFIPLVARLGGYNGRAHDPPPGPQAIWVGIRRMTDFAIAWNAFGPGTTYET